MIRRMPRGWGIVVCCDGGGCDARVATANLLPPRKPALEFEDRSEDDLEPLSPEGAKLDQELERSFIDEEAGKLIDADAALANLKSRR